MLEDLTVWYLFLGGAGAGCLLVAAVLECLSPHAIVANDRRRPTPEEAYRPFFMPSYVAGFAAVAIGALCLLLDLGRGERALSLIFQPTLSFISVGVFLLIVLMVLAAAPLSFWAFGRAGFPKPLMLAVRVLLALAAFSVMTYTGLFLSGMPSVPLWNTLVLPALFVASALSSGIALLVCVVFLTGSSERFASAANRLRAADAVVIVCEVILLALFVGAAFLKGGTAQASAERLVQGDLSAPFLGLVVLLGLVVPFACEALARKVSERAVVAAAVLVLAGGFFLRWCIVEAGMAVDIAASVMPALGIQ